MSESKTVISYVGNIHHQDNFTENSLEKASFSIIALKLLKTTLIIGTVGLLAFGIISLFEITWLNYLSGFLLTGIAGLIIYSSVASYIAPCPYCNHTVGKTLDDPLTKEDRNSRVDCPNCKERLISNKGVLKAFTSEKGAYRSSFHTAVFKNGVWPNECITCGDIPTHFDRANQTKFNASKLLIGRLSVSAGSVSNIPYCDKHQEDVSIKIKDDELNLVFSEFGAYRRYMIVNKKW